MAAYYNENDRYAAQWLRNLIADGQIAPGDVDERSIADVTAADLAGYAQCHFFAGIGGWSYALRLAGWPDSRPVWTGSCPCQPFSAAGKRGGVDDARHLWPVWQRLIGECRPSIVFGEQVASKDGRAWWFNLVQPDLERMGMAASAADMCAPGVGAPHIRQRLWWLARRASGGFGKLGREDWPGGQRHANRRNEINAVADATSERRERGIDGGIGQQPETRRLFSSGPSEHGVLADSHGGLARHRELQRSGEHGQFATDGTIDDVADAPIPRLEIERDGEQRQRPAAERTGAGVSGALGHADGVNGPQERAGLNPVDEQRTADGGRSIEPAGTGTASGNGGGIDAARNGESRSFWSGAVWIECSDGKARPTQPGIFPLVNGISGKVVVECPGKEAETLPRLVSRTGALRGAGNAIVPELSAEFIGAAMEIFTVDRAVKAG